MNTTALRSVITLSALFDEMRRQILEQLRWTLACSMAIVIAAAAFAVLRPQDYVASMIIVPVETSATSDATSQMLSTGLSLRSPFSLGGPPPQMAAYLKILKSPEVARSLAQDQKASAYIIDHRLGPIGYVRAAIGSLFGAPSPADTLEDRVADIMQWLDSHVTVDQDVTLMAWTINVRQKDRDAARYILEFIQKCDEGILRNAAIKQYSTQHDYILKSAYQTDDAAIKQTYYTALNGVDRALVALRSGANVATIEVSKPYVPTGKSYPPRVASFSIAVVVLLLIAIVRLIVLSYVALKRQLGGDRQAEFAAYHVLPHR